MAITQKEVLKKYGINVDEDKLRMVQMGGGQFAEKGEILGTIGLGLCVGLLAYSEDMCYLSHIDMGNLMGMNFDSKGASVRLKEIELAIARLRQKGEVKPIKLATISSQTFIYDKKWWSEREVSFDQQIEQFVQRCNQSGIPVERMPHMQGSFAVIDSNNGEFYVEQYGYAVKTNINDMSEKKYLNSLDESSFRSSMITEGLGKSSGFGISSFDFHPRKR